MNNTLKFCEKYLELGLNNFSWKKFKGNLERNLEGTFPLMYGLSKLPYNPPPPVRGQVSVMYSFHISTRDNYNSDQFFSQI